MPTRPDTILESLFPDLVLLDKDSLADVHNTRTIEAVVLSGKFLDRAALDAMLAEAQALADK